MDANLSTAVDYYHKNKRMATAFLVLFAITSSTMAWDFIMSIEPHWFSTMFGWYTFAGMFITSLSALMFILAYLKSKGYLQEVTANHLQDVGKFMFAFSIFGPTYGFASSC